MAANITQEHRLSIDGRDYVLFAETRNGAPAERWRIAIVCGGEWRVCASSHPSRKEAFDKLYLLAIPEEVRRPATPHR